jgi:hypothetical protein
MRSRDVHMLQREGGEREERKRGRKEGRERDRQGGSLQEEPRRRVCVCVCARARVRMEGPRYRCAAWATFPSSSVRACGSWKASCCRSMKKETPTCSPDLYDGYTYIHIE